MKAAFKIFIVGIIALLYTYYTECNSPKIFKIKPHESEI